jgi:uroporphyrinogen decarboxylase
MKQSIAEIRREVDRPIIYFANVGASPLSAAGQVGADVMGIHWTVPLSRATEELGSETVLQGNLDPAALFSPRKELESAVRAVLTEGSGAAAHIFNLGHGIDSATDPDQLAFLVERVHECSIAPRQRFSSEPATPRV